MGDNDADFPVAQVVALFTAKAVALVVDSLAVCVAATNARALNAEVKGVEVARHAVKVVFIPEDTAVGQARRGGSLLSDDGL